MWKCKYCGVTSPQSVSECPKCHMASRAFRGRRFWLLAYVAPKRYRVVTTCEAHDRADVHRAFKAHDVVAFGEGAAHFHTCNCTAVRPCAEWIGIIERFGCDICGVKPTDD